MIRSASTRLGALTLLLAVVGAGSLPCVCPDMPATGLSRTHCGQGDPGFRTRHAGCDCPCLTAKAEPLAGSRSEHASVRALALTPVTAARGTDSPMAVEPPSALRRAGATPSPPLVLRI